MPQMATASRWGRETLPHAPVNRQDGSRNREVLKRDFMFEKQQPGSPETGHPVHKQKGVTKIVTPTTTKAARMRTADRKEGQQ